MGDYLVVSFIIRTFVLLVVHTETGSTKRQGRRGWTPTCSYVWSWGKYKAGWSLLGPHLVNGYSTKVLKIFDIHKYYFHYYCRIFVYYEKDKQV